MKRKAFLVTKPLQFMIAATIIKELGISDRSDIIVTDTFYGAENFVSMYRDLSPHGGLWGRVSILRTVDDAYRYILKEKNYTAIFIDSDVGVSKFVTLFLQKIRHRKRKIIVYEEGTGTYRTNLYKEPKRFLFKSLGVGSAFGGCTFTDGIYIYDKELYNKVVGSYGAHNCFTIMTPLYSFIQDNLPVLKKLFSVPSDFTSGLSGSIALYLSSFIIDHKVISDIKGKFDHILIKPHPHLSGFNPRDHNLSPSSVISPGTPAELIVVNMASKSRNLTIYHHDGNSTAHYTKIDGVQFVRV